MFNWQKYLEMPYFTQAQTYELRSNVTVLYITISWYMVQYIYCLVVYLVCL